jgi:hypothetical protein
MNSLEKIFCDYVQKPCWVEWRLEGDDRSKVPYTPGTNRKASVSRPASGVHWHSAAAHDAALLQAATGWGLSI